MIDPEIAKKVVSVLPPVTRPSLSRKRKNLALVIAIIADTLQIAVIPLLLPGYVIDDGLDIIAALLLLLLCGPRWQFALAFVIELVPGISLFPTWTTFVIALPVTPDPKLPPPSPNSRAAAETNLPKPPQQLTSEVVRVGRPD